MAQLNIEKDWPTHDFGREDMFGVGPKAYLDSTKRSQRSLSRLQLLEAGLRATKRWTLGVFQKRVVTVRPAILFAKVILGRLCLGLLVPTQSPAAFVCPGPHRLTSRLVKSEIWQRSRRLGQMRRLSAADLFQKRIKPAPPSRLN